MNEFFDAIWCGMKLWFMFVGMVCTLGTLVIFLLLGLDTMNERD